MTRAVGTGRVGHRRVGVDAPAWGERLRAELRVPRPTGRGRRGGGAGPGRLAGQVQAGVTSGPRRRVQGVIEARLPTLRAKGPARSRTLGPPGPEHSVYSRAARGPGRTCPRRPPRGQERPVHARARCPPSAVAGGRGPRSARTVGRRPFRRPEPSLPARGRQARSRTAVGSRPMVVRPVRGEARIHTPGIAEAKPPGGPCDRRRASTPGGVAHPRARAAAPASSMRRPLTSGRGGRSGWQDARAVLPVACARAHVGCAASPRSPPRRRQGPPAVRPLPGLPGWRRRALAAGP